MNPLVLTNIRNLQLGGYPRDGLGTEVVRAGIVEFPSLQSLTLHRIILHRRSLSALIPNPSNLKHLSINHPSDTSGDLFRLVCRFPQFMLWWLFGQHTYNALEYRAATIYSTIAHHPL